MNIYDRLTELNITLPPVSTPAAAYVPFVQTGNLVFLSGHIAKKDGKVWVGQLGANMSTDEAKQAARAVGAQGLKALGASGGGCVMIVSAADDVARVVEAVSPFGDVLPWRIAACGVEVSWLSPDA